MFSSSWDSLTLSKASKDAVELPTSASKPTATIAIAVFIVPVFAHWIVRFGISSGPNGHVYGNSSLVLADGGQFGKPICMMGLLY